MSLRKSSRFGRNSGQQEVALAAAKDFVRTTSVGRTSNNISAADSLTVKPDMIVKTEVESSAKIRVVKGSASQMLATSDTEQIGRDAKQTRKLINQAAEVASRRWRRAVNAQVATNRFAKAGADAERRRQELELEQFAEADAGSELTVEQYVNR